MFFLAIRKILVSLILATVCLANFALANEAPAKEEKKEAAKEAGAEAAPAEGESTESQKKQQNEAAELQTRVQALQAKIKAKEENIKKLIEDKTHSKDAAKIRDILQEMVKEHREMGKMIEEYEANRSLLRYRYPEKGYKGVRSYERMEVKPLEQMETQMSVEAKLKRNMKTLQSQFGTSDGEAGSKKKKESTKHGDGAPTLTEPIVIQK